MTNKIKKVSINPIETFLFYWSWIFFQKTPTMADFRFLRAHFFWFTLYLLLLPSFTDLSSITHPVHFYKGHNLTLSPSAFIPFCEFGGDMTAMGVKIDEFDIPVCNSFQAKILNDQLCYEVDLQQHTNVNNFENDLKLGLVLLIDYNEDRQVTLQKTVENHNSDSLVGSIDASHDDDSATIYLNTIGKIHFITVIRIQYSVSL